MKPEDIPEEDTKFEDFVIEEVSEEGDNGWSIRTDKSAWFFVKKKHGKPEVGQTARFYGHGFGSTVRGLVINGKVLYYLTEDQQDAQHKKWVEDQNTERKRKFEEEGREKLDAQYETLPDVFKQRIDKFRTNNPDFRWEFEGYEMFCCTEAVKIAEALKTADAIQEFYKMKYKEQQKLVELDDGHSGNTFGAACKLAIYYLELPEGVVKTHGALAPLVGSETYGCIPRSEPVTEK